MTQHNIIWETSTYDQRSKTQTKKSVKKKSTTWNLQPEKRKISGSREREVRIKETQDFNHMIPKSK